MLQADLTAGTGLALASLGATVGASLSVGTLRAAASVSRELTAGAEDHPFEALKQHMLPGQDA